jgi:hypothetical protein
MTWTPRHFSSLSSSCCWLAVFTAGDAGSRLVARGSASAGAFPYGGSSVRGRAAKAFGTANASNEVLILISPDTPPGLLLCYPTGMDEAATLHVEIEDDEIVVTKRGTRLLVAYRKSVDQPRPRLVITRCWMGPTTTAPGINEFRAQAWQAAVAKARELGWIV